MEYTLKHGGFEVYLQPKVKLNDLGFVGVEALVRRQHEDGKTIPSGELEMLWKVGCGSGQGHYLSRSLSMDVFPGKYCQKMIDESQIILYNNLCYLREQRNVEVAELIDAHDSGPCGSNILRVRLSSSALTHGTGS